MKGLLRVFSLIHAIMAALFAVAAVLLMAMATHKAWTNLAGGITKGSAQEIIEAIGYLAAAVVALQIAQTIAEEEVIRGAHVSGPTRVRRFLSRFMVVLIVALAIEGLVGTFRGVHDSPAVLLPTAALLFGTGVLLAAWGVFIRLNRYAEELEPEAMQEAKLEDRKLQT